VVFKNHSSNTCKASAYVHIVLPEVIKIEAFFCDAKRVCLQVELAIVEAQHSPEYRVSFGGLMVLSRCVLKILVTLAIPSARTNMLN
jgi:hypothetical protein